MTPKTEHTFSLLSSYFFQSAICIQAMFLSLFVSTMHDQSMTKYLFIVDLTFFKLTALLLPLTSQRSPAINLHFNLFLFYVTHSYSIVCFCKPYQPSLNNVIPAYNFWKLCQVTITGSFLRFIWNCHGFYQHHLSCRNFHAVNIATMLASFFTK